MRTYNVMVRYWERSKLGGFYHADDQYPQIEAGDGAEACECAELLAKLDHPEAEDFRAWNCTINRKE